MLQLNERVRRAPKGQREQIGQFVSHPMEAAGPVKELQSKQQQQGRGGAWAPQVRFFLRKHTGVVNDCCVDPRGRFVVTVSDDQSALVWKADSGQLLGSLTGGASARSEVRACCFNADGVLLATGSASGAVELWDANGHGEGDWPWCAFAVAVVAVVVCGCRCGAFCQCFRVRTGTAPTLSLIHI